MATFVTKTFYMFKTDRKKEFKKNYKAKKGNFVI